MNHRLKVIVVVVLTFVITFSGGFLTENTRQSMIYSWAIDVGDELVYDIIVVGNTTTDTRVLLPPLAPLNNTHIVVEITSLPNLTLMHYSNVFIQEVVNYLKTTSRFEDGSSIPSNLYRPIDSRASMSLLPIGGWNHLDALFPDQVNSDLSNFESFISRYDTDNFIFGYWSNWTTTRIEVTDWHGVYDIETGVPILITISESSLGPLTSYFYTVTMTLVND